MDDLKLTPEDVKARLDRGMLVIFLDTRSPQSWAASDQQLPRSLRATPDEVKARSGAWAEGTLVVAYCT